MERRREGGKKGGRERYVLGRGYSIEERRRES